MQMAITLLAVVGGLIFSLAIALLAEEIIFGQVFRLFFAGSRLSAKEMVASSVKVVRKS
jgi:ABC-type enterobactin transport system permease subunit